MRDDHVSLQAIGARTKKSMDVLAAAIDFVFGCHHSHLSRVFTIERQTYRVCCECGAKFKYSLETMSTEQRLHECNTLTWHLIDCHGRGYESTRGCRT